MNYLPAPTSDVDNPTRPLAAMGAIARAYSRIFADSRYADKISKARPVRNIGFDLDLDIVDSAPLADDVRVLTLARPDGQALPAWTPGAHLDVFTEGGRQRHYSLTGDPADTSRYRIAVRAIPGGEGSAEMHRLRAGDTLAVRGPRNAFPFAHDRQVLFVAGGIGITPILPMVRAAHDAGIDWRLAYSGRSRASMPFLDDLLALDSTRVDVRTDDVDGTPDVRDLLAIGTSTAPIYLCGPSPMLDAARELISSEQPSRALHAERFAPPPPIDGEAFRIDFTSGGSVEVAADETALSAIRRVKPDVRYSCQQGFCGACRVKVCSGSVTHHDRVLIGDEREDSMMICVSRAAGDHVVIDL